MTYPKIGQGVRKWLMALVCLVTYVAGHADVKGEEPLTATKVFADAPLEVLDMIRPSTRLDMIDYYTQADSLLVATNALGGECRLETVAPDYLKVSVSPVSTLEIKVLPAGKKQVVMTLYTTGDPEGAQDTDVRFFDSTLKPLDPSKYLKAPDLAAFFSLKGSGIAEDDLADKIPYAAIVYVTGPGDTPLNATLTTLRIISQEDRDLLTPLLTPTLTSTWKNAYRFK